MFLDIADQTKIKTDIEVRRQVANAYGNVLISQERVKILENNYNNIIKTLDETTAIYENGLIESESVDQLTITSSSIKNSLEYAIKFENLSERILKLLLGIELDDKIVLNDDIESIIVKSIDPELVNTDFNVEENIDYKIALNAKKGSETLLRLEKVKALPRISAFISGAYNGYNESFKITDPKQKAMIYVMPVMMLFLLKSLSSGFILYFIIFNLLSVAQRFMVHDKKDDEPKRKPVVAAPGVGSVGNAGQRSGGGKKKKKK